MGVRRALDVLDGRFLGCVDGLPAAIVDYRVEAWTQSKYYNGLRNTLECLLACGVSTRTSPALALPHRPDHASAVRTLSPNRSDRGLSCRRADGIRGSLDDLEQATGRLADDLIEPGEATYAEVQQGRVHDTIRKREDVLDRENKELKRRRGPSTAHPWRASVRPRLLCPTARGGIGLKAVDLAQAPRGRVPFGEEFSMQPGGTSEWSRRSAINGGAVADCSVRGPELHCPGGIRRLRRGLMGIGGLLRDSAGDDRLFRQMAHIIVLDAAIAGTAAGQTLIPIPLLGTLIVRLAGNLVASALKDGLGKSESAFTARLS